MWKAMENYLALRNIFSEAHSFHRSIFYQWLPPKCRVKSTTCDAVQWRKWMEDTRRWEDRLCSRLTSSRSGGLHVYIYIRNIMRLSTQLGLFAHRLIDVKGPPKHVFLNLFGLQNFPLWIDIYKWPEGKNIRLLKNFAHYQILKII